MDSPKPTDPPAPKISRALPGQRSALTQAVLENHLAYDAAGLQIRIKRGAYWFYWVAALSLVNSVIALKGGSVSFLAGLALPQLADGLAAHLGFAGPYFSIGTDLVFAVFLCGFGYLASHGSRAALIAGMICYALDAMVFVYFSAYLPVLFHAFVLFQMHQSWSARQKLDKLRSESPTLAGQGSE